MTELLIVVACYLTFYANVGGTAVQVLALMLLCGAAAWAMMLGKIKAIPVSAAELVMYAAGTISVVLGVLSAEDAVGPSIAFLAAIVAISVLCRTVSLERLMDAGACVAFLCVITCLIVEHAKVMQALSISIGRNGLLRLAPLENHPDLTGYIFGTGSILLMRRVLVSKNTFERIAAGTAGLLAWVFIFAASSRSSIIALFVAGVITIIFEFRGSRFVSFKWIGIALTSFAVIVIPFADKIVNYINAMLELDSSARGVESGGSGRVDLWWRGVATLFNDPITLAVGGGFRSSSSELIGFSTESSYITILLDSGLFIGSAIILIFLLAPLKALRLSPPGRRHLSPLVLLPCFLTFVVIESIFNRYLLAIGNPASLVTLLILLSLSISRDTANSAVDAPRNLMPPSAILRHADGQN